jgi:hypothetical protein
MITGVDYVFYTKKEPLIFFNNFEKRLSAVWNNFYKEDDKEDNMYNVFYAPNKQIFDEMDDKGFFLNAQGEGPIYLIFNHEYSDKESRITIVLPTLTNKSNFCRDIYMIVQTCSE